MKDTLGGKGAGLAEMCRAGVPVPPGFTISTEVCNIYFENKQHGPGRDRRADAGGAREARRAAWARSSATPTNPLLVSVRSGAKFSMPGMMDTILNLGLNDETVEGAGRQERQSALRLRLLPPLHPDVRRRGARHRQARISTTVFDGRKNKAKAKLDTDLDRRRSEGRSSPDYKKLVKKKTEQAVPAGRRASSSPWRAMPCSAPGGTNAPSTTAR